MDTIDAITGAYGGHFEGLLRQWRSVLASEGFDGIVVHGGWPVLRFLDDQYHPFSANPHLQAWAPLGRHPGAVLIVDANRPRLYLYQPEDYWHARAEQPENWWADHFDLRLTDDSEAWRKDLSDRHFAFVGDAPDLADEEHLNPNALLTQLHLLRTRKSDYEIACMRAAQRLAVPAHRAAAEAFSRGVSEYDIHQSYLAACRQQDHELPYPNIIALNEHAAVLHYTKLDRQTPGQHLSFLIDAGASYHGYAADISRSFAASEGAYADMLLALESRQLALCARVSDGIAFPDLHHLAHLAIAEVLNEAGIIAPAAEEAVALGLVNPFFPHGLGHLLGLQVHDVAGRLGNDGEELPVTDEQPYLRMRRTLETGNVVTIEPGIYFIDILLQQARAGELAQHINWAAVEALKPYGGIRIEDNVLVTEAGPENLTREAFNSI